MSGRDGRSLARALGPWAAGVLLLAAFAASIIPYADLPENVDTCMAIWLARTQSWLRPLVDPLTAGYVYVFFFEPLFTLLHVPDAYLEPWLGNVAYHLMAAVGLLGCAAVLAVLVRDATRSSWLALAAAALLLLSAVSWVAVGETTCRHYAFGAAAALLAVRPAWLAYQRGHLPGAGASWLSAAAYLVSVACKEAGAGLPLFIAALLLAARAGVWPTVRFVVPHALALAALLAWRLHILGGLGGYFFTPSLFPLNLVLAPASLFAAVWGSAWVGAALVAVGIGLRPRGAGLWLAAALATCAPFVFAMPMQPSPLYATRLLLAFALFLLLGMWSWSALPRRLRMPAAVGLTGALLVLQWAQRARVEADLASVTVADARQQAAESRVVVSPAWLSYTCAHLQLPHASNAVLGLRSAMDWRLYRALGGEPPPGARVDLPEAAPIELVPLAPDAVSFEVDASGHARLGLAHPETGLWVALWFQNGSTQWLASLPLRRERIAFPLSRSIRALVVFQPNAGAQWPASVWRSPFFVDPYPPPRAPG